MKIKNENPEMWPGVHSCTGATAPLQFQTVATVRTSGFVAPNTGDRVWGALPPLPHPSMLMLEGTPMKNGDETIDPRTCFLSFLFQVC